MSMNYSLSPIVDNRFDRAAARHLLWRAGYAGTPAELTELQAMGLDRAVAHLVDYRAIDLSALPEIDLDPTILRKRTPEERERYRTARREGDQDTLDEFRRQGQQARAADRKQFAKLRDWWLGRMLRTPRPAEERLVLLWHGHFASSYRAVRDAYLLQQQQALFREHANGSFADLARGIVRDPAMLKYLNNDRNHKNRPNENLARELMELFTLGVGNYSERDIKEGARALTGFGVDDDDFILRDRQHDPEPKTILGRTGNFNGDDFVEILLRHDACARFVALKLYDHFVADVGDVYEDVPRDRRRVIEAIATRLIRHDYQVQPVLEILFKSQHFHDPENVGRKIKDPTQLLVGTVRGLGTPTRQHRALVESMNAMGQSLLEPPTVDGWDGGRSWINTSTLFVRQNLCTYLISGKHPVQRYKRGEINYEPEQLLVGLDDRSPAAVTDHLLDHLVGTQTPEPRRQPLRRFMAERNQGVTNDSLVALLCLITAMPEYQLC
jgi:hypothetical protein